MATAAQKEATRIETERRAEEEKARQETERLAKEASDREEREASERRANDPSLLSKSATETEGQIETRRENNDPSLGSSAATTTSGADTGPEASTTEAARVDDVEITRPNQRLVKPEDHGHLAPPFLSMANIPPGSEPTVIDPATGRPAEKQIADEDESRLDAYKDD